MSKRLSCLFLSCTSFIADRLFSCTGSLELLNRKFVQVIICYLKILVLENQDKESPPNRPPGNQSLGAFLPAEHSQVGEIGNPPPSSRLFSCTGSLKLLNRESVQVCYLLS